MKNILNIQNILFSSKILTLIQTVCAFMICTIFPDAGNVIIKVDKEVNNYV